MMKNELATSMPTVSKEELERRSASQSDVISAYMSSGVDGVLATMPDLIENKSTILNAAKFLASQGLDTKDILALFESKVKTEKEESRISLVQEKNGNHFVMVPVNSLNVDVGQKVKVRFEFGEAVLTPYSV